MCTCQIIDCLKAKKECTPFQSWWGSALISYLFAWHVQEMSAGRRGEVPLQQHPGRRRGYHELGLSFLCFFLSFSPLSFLPALYRRGTRPGSNALTLTPDGSEYLWRTHGWDSNNSLISDNGGVTGKGLGEFAGVFKKKRCTFWNRMWQKCSWRAALFVEVHFEQYPNMLTCSFIHFKRNITSPCN